MIGFRTRAGDGLATTPSSPGFCFEPAQDDDFAKGWPHVRRLTDASVEYHTVAAQRLMDADFDLKVHWPRQVAAALVHAWGGGELFMLVPGERLYRDATQEAFWNAETPTPDQVRAYLRERLLRCPLWSSDRATESFVLMLEALTSAELVATAIVEELEAMSLSQLHESATQPAWITFQLGYLLLRAPEAKASALKARMRRVLEEQAGLREGGVMKVGIAPSHARSLLLVLDGAAAADRLTDKGVRWYTHATDAHTVKMRVSMHKGGGMPDVRLAYLGGADLLNKPLYQRWAKMPARDQRWFFESVAPVRHRHVVTLMSNMLGTPLKAPVVAWFQAHASYARPLLEVVANERKEARAALEVL